MKCGLHDSAHDPDVCVCVCVVVMGEGATLTAAVVSLAVMPRHPQACVWVNINCTLFFLQATHLNISNSHPITPSVQAQTHCCPARVHPAAAAWRVSQVQKHSIPVLLSGRDALVRSPTGSGKTLAYLAPLVHSLAGAQPRISRADGTHAVVLVPTRELAVQVGGSLVLGTGHWGDQLCSWLLDFGGKLPRQRLDCKSTNQGGFDLSPFCAVTHWTVVPAAVTLCVCAQVSDVLTALARRFCWLVSGILIGGEHRGHEKARLRKGVTILVATPGRLMDHLEVRS